MAFRSLVLLLVLVCCSAALHADERHPLGAHAAFPVDPAFEGGAHYTYMSVKDPEALNLDGSIYGIAVCLSNVSKANWTFSADGGGWCYDEDDCYGRSSTGLGSNKTWPGEAAQMFCNPQDPMSRARFFYGDGASRSGNVKEPVSVAGKPNKLWFRGQPSLDAGIDLLLELGMNEAELIVFTGGSAGGLTVFLHLDHVAERMRTEAPKARVVGEPVCGFFADLPTDGYTPQSDSYPNRMKYVYNMQNAGPSLSSACQAFYGSDAWRCIMAPHASQFVNTPWFALQSRFDTWQLGNIAQLPCTSNPLSCNETEWQDMQAYGKAFMMQFAPFQTPTSHNGAFLDACLIHGSTSAEIDGLRNAEAFQSWLSGNKTYGNWWTQKCSGLTPAAGGDPFSGPCDRASSCAKFPTHT